MYLSFACGWWLECSLAGSNVSRATAAYLYSFPCSWSSTSEARNRRSWRCKCYKTRLLKKQPSFLGRHNDRNFLSSISSIPQLWSRFHFSGLWQNCALISMHIPDNQSESRDDWTGISLIPESQLFRNWKEGFLRLRFTKPISRRKNSIAICFFDPFPSSISNVSEHIFKALGIIFGSFDEPKV